jgi:polyhydroxybutyrate depolymerase
MTSRMTHVVALLSTVVAAVIVSGCATSPTAAVPQAAGPAVVAVAASSATTTLEVDGVARTVIVHDAVSTEGLAPALLVLHGASSGADPAEQASGLTGIAERDGFVVAYPQGLSTGRKIGGHAWNAGRCCAAPAAEGVDDVAFLDALVDALIADHGVDPEKVYLTGFSNGGMMSYRYACERAERVAGIAVVGGALNFDACAPSRPVPTLIVHGTSDATVPYDGGPPNARTAARLGSWVSASVADSAAFWSRVNGCDASEVTDVTASYRREEYSGCTDGAPLEVVSVEGGTHRWPIVSEQGFGASEAIVAYFDLATSTGTVTAASDSDGTSR